MAEKQSNENRSAPGEGGWVPSQGTPIVAAVLLAICGTVGPVAVATFPRPWGLFVAATTGGLAAGITAYLGLKSAGPRKGG